MLPPDFDRDEQVATETRKKLKKPPLFKVILHNDDYTSMEFVVYVLETVFHKNRSVAMRTMLDVHHHGTGVAGIYTFEIAETKANQTVTLARQYEFPLLCTVEPE